MTPTITVIVSTLGRPTLRDTLDSMARQARIPGDRMIVCIDSFEQGERPDIQAMVRSYGFECYVYDAGYHFFGIEQHNYVMREVVPQTTHLLSLGDDDVFVDGMFEALRPFAEPDLLRPLLFRFHLVGYGLLWDIPAMRRCHISGQCMFVPMSLMKPVDTRHDCTVDFDWMQDVIQASGKEPLWLDYVGVIARPPRHSETGRALHSMWRCSRCTHYGWTLDPHGVLCKACGHPIEEQPQPKIVEAVAV